MIIWTAYIDESGTHEGSSNIVVAAVLGSAVAWQELRPKWDAVLRLYGLSYFHGVDFNGSTGECAKLTKEERIDCVKKLIEVASNATLEYITFAVERTLYESKRTDMSVYDYLLGSTIGDLMTRGEDIGIDGMYVFIEDGCGLSTRFCNLLRKAAPARKYLGPIGNISYLDKDHVPLQVADMIAYETFKSLDNHIRSPKKPTRKSFEKIIEGNPLSAYLIDEEWLDLDLPKVQRFWNSITRNKLKYPLRVSRSAFSLS